MSGYWTLPPRWLQRPASVLLLEPSHWVMQTRQFANLKRRVELNRKHQIDLADAARSSTASKGIPVAEATLSGGGRP